MKRRVPDVQDVILERFSFRLKNVLKCPEVPEAISVLYRDEQRYKNVVS